jgi:hypothetical protein
MEKTSKMVMQLINKWTMNLEPNPENIDTRTANETSKVNNQGYNTLEIPNRVHFQPQQASSTQLQQSERQWKSTKKLDFDYYMNKNIETYPLTYLQ